MTPLSDTETTLKELFDSAVTLSTQLASLSATTTAYSQTLELALSKLQACRQLTSTASLFSSNESLDDLPTSSLQYLSIDYHLATLLPRTPTHAVNGDAAPPNPTAVRKNVLAEARDSYSLFLSRLDDYGLLSAPERKLFARYTSSPSEFSVLGSGGGGAGGSNAASQRAAKIARFQAEKELKASLTTAEGQAYGLNADEDMLRRARLAELALQSHRAFEGLDQVALEERMLAMAPTDAEPPARIGNSQDFRERDRKGDGYSERLDIGLNRSGARAAGPLLDEKGKPLRPFTLLGQREAARKGVFRPGHRLPTMSIEEYLEAEKARGGIIEGGGELPEKVIDEDDIEAADRDTMKAREWDEFVESNPRGSGNTLNRG